PGPPPRPARSGRGPGRGRSATPRRRRRGSSARAVAGSGAPVTRCLQLRQGDGALVLDVAERAERREVVLVGALPGAVVRLTPAQAIVGRARVGVERHGLVRPDAVGDEPVAPILDEGGLVLDRADEVRLYEGDEAAGVDEQLGELLRVELAALGQGRAPLDGEALEAGFD